MKTNKLTEPDYDFELIELSYKEIKDLRAFTSEQAILKCTRGSAVISINSSVHDFKASSNFILFDAMNFSVIECSEDIRVIACKFSAQFLNEIYAGLDNKVIDSLWYSAPDLYSEQEAESINLTFEKLCLLYKNQDHMYRHKIAINLVICYMYEMYEIIYHRLASTPVNTGNYASLLSNKFGTLCHKHHKTQRNIEFYAKELGVSSRYLSKIMSTYGITPKQMIDYYVSGTAKILLLSTSLTNQQIADQLNFPDQATFGQFFKRNVGMPPTEFRNKYK